MTDVAGKTAFITGGASGLGLATARALAAKGASVILADIDGAGAEAAAASLRSSGGKALGLQLDVTSEASWAEAGAKARAFGPVRILFSNAGVGGGSGREGGRARAARHATALRAQRVSSPTRFCSMRPRSSAPRCPRSSRNPSFAVAASTVRSDPSIAPAAASSRPTA